MSDSGDNRVPPEIGEFEGMAESVRKGYAAYLDGKDYTDNPYTRRPGESFSGFKRRREKNWEQGWKLAAVREGGYDSLAAVEDAFDDIYLQKPRAPRKSLYTSPGGSETPLDIHAPYVYRVNGGDYHETRHDAIGEAAERYHEGGIGVGPGSGRPPMRYLKWVSAHERVRRPQLPPEDDDDD